MLFSHVNQKTTYTDPRLAFAEEVKNSPLDFRQKFDGSSTALQVLHGRDMSGKYVIVTGANSGIGEPVLLSSPPSFAVFVLFPLCYKNSGISMQVLLSSSAPSCSFCSFSMWS